MTTGTRHFNAPDLPNLGARTYRPFSPQDVKRRLRHDLCIYDTLIWDGMVIMRLPHHYYRISFLCFDEDIKAGKTERLGGKSATYALAVLLKRLGLDGSGTEMPDVTMRMELTFGITREG
jgi:hypothetical protein